MESVTETPPRATLCVSPVVELLPQSVSVLGRRVCSPTLESEDEHAEPARSVPVVVFPVPVSVGESSSSSSEGIVRVKRKRAPVHECKVCHRWFFRLDHLCKHVDVIHSKKYKHFCDVCGKGFADVTHQRKHVQKHTDAEAARPFVMNALHKQVVAASAELCALRKAAARARQSACSDERCAVSVSRGSSASELPHFKCFACNNATHLGCAGYSLGMALDTVLLCPACIQQQQLLPEACLLEHDATARMQQYLRDSLCLTVLAIPADGACMLRAVLASMKADGQMPAGRDVCEFLRAVIRSVECMRDAFPDLCAELLQASNAVILYKLRALWDSALFDDLLFYIAKYLKRDVHVFVCITSEVLRNVIECGSDSAGPPVCVMRTCTLLRYDHYSAVY